MNCKRTAHLLTIKLNNYTVKGKLHEEILSSKQCETFTVTERLYEDNELSKDAICKGNEKSYNNYDVHGSVDEQPTLIYY